MPIWVVMLTAIALSMLFITPSVDAFSLRIFLAVQSIMSEETHSPSVSADDVKKPVENGIPNGQETPPMKSGPSHSNENINAQCNHNNTPEEENGHQPNSSTPLAQKKAPSVPLLTINEDENDDEGVVKGKPFGHSRKGSSISQVGGKGGVNCGRSLL